MHPCSFSFRACACLFDPANYQVHVIQREFIYDSHKFIANYDTTNPRALWLNILNRIYSHGRAIIGLIYGREILRLYHTKRPARQACCNKFVLAVMYHLVISLMMIPISHSIITAVKQKESTSFEISASISLSKQFCRFVNDF